MTLLAVGLSGGRVLSPAAVFRNLRAFDPGILLQLITLALLLVPLAWLAVLIRWWRGSR